MALSETTRQSLGSSRLSIRARSPSGPPSDASASFADVMIAPRRLSSVNAADGIAFSVGSQPPQPCRLGFRPSLLQKRSRPRWRQSSMRSKYVRMWSARHDESPVMSAIWFQSELCGYTKIIALCAVHPPSVPARG